MKRLLAFVVFIFMMCLNTAAYADDILGLQAKVNGNLAAGESIDITIYGSNVKDLYAGDIMLKFNPEILQITGIEKGSLIKKDGVGSFEQKGMPGVNNQPNNIVRYIFTCTGITDGYSGEGPIVTFKAKVLKKADFYINSKPFLKNVTDYYNLKMQFCDKTITSELNYNFTPYGKVPPEPSGDSAGSTAGNTGTTENTGTGQSAGNSGGSTQTAASNGSNTNNTSAEPSKDTNGSNNTNGQTSSGDAGNKTVQQNTDTKNAGTNKQSSGEASDNKEVKSKGNSALIYVLVIGAAAAAGGGLYFIKFRRR